MDFLVRNRNLFIFISIAVALPFIIQLPRVKTVDNVDYFTLEDDADVAFYEEVKSVFGEDEFFIIAFEKENLFTFDNLSLLKKITEELEQIEEIRQIKSLANVDDTIGENDYFIVQPFLEEIPEAEDELINLKTRAVANPLYRKNFISSDGRTAAILISVYDSPDDPGYRKRLIEKCESVIEKYSSQLGDVHFAGWTTTNLFLSQFMKKDIATFIPITYLFITIAVFLFFRNIWLTGIAILNISICMGATMGLFPLFDITLNNVTTIVPPIVMALSLCDTVHIFSHLNKDLLSKFDSKEKALSYVLNKVIRPCFLTTLTTAVGFFSLYLSDIPPIKDFAVVASLGMIFEFFFSFALLPGLILLVGTNRTFVKRKKSETIGILLEKTAGLVEIYYKRIAIVGLVVIIASVLLIFRINVETNLLGYFKPNSEIRQATSFVEERLAGTVTLDISLQATVEDAFKKPENLRIIEQIQDYTDSLEGVDKTLSFVDFIKDMNQSFHNEQPEYLTIPESKNLVAQYLLLYDADDIEDFVNSSFDHARVTIRLSEHSTAGQSRIIESLTLFINSVKKNDLNIRITGRALQDVNTIDSLVKGQIYSLSVAALIIMVIMFFVLKSISMGWLSVIPNLFPIIINLGIMGLFSIPLNTATALIAAVAIGIAVDDTIHFLSDLKYRLSRGEEIQKALRGTIGIKGRAILLSSLILSIGFGVMVFSRFVPTVHFGVLSSIIMFMAVIGDILLLPSIAILLSKFGIRFYTVQEKNYEK